METYRLHRGRLIDHIQLVVNDFEASKAFYTAVLAVLEIPVVNTYDDYFWADELVVSSINSPVPQVSRQDAIIWLSRQGIVRRWMLFTRRRWHTAAVITERPVSELITRGTTRPLYSIPMVTTSKRFTMARGNAVRHRWRLASVFKHNDLRAGPYWAVGIKSDQEPAHELAISKPS